MDCRDRVIAALGNLVWLVALLQTPVVAPAMPADAPLSSNDASESDAGANTPETAAGSPESSSPILRTVLNDPAVKTGRPPFQWSKALRQSAVFLGLQHAFRMMTEPGSRAELRGPFFKDYWLSVRGYGSWRDGDNQFTNYVGHPMMGASSGWIYVHNDPRARREQFSWTKGYWSSRLRAMCWSTAYSTIFELGPASEASIGNRGKERWNAGLVDLVVTPTLGTGLLVVEDMLDRYVVLAIERRWPNKVVVALTRAWLNPNRSFANMLRLKKPYHRDTRRLKR